MTPARRKTLTDAVDLIASTARADGWATQTGETREALIRLGARFVDGNTNTMRLAGVTASCTWDAGEHLLTRWAANARAAMAEGDDTNRGAEEEE